jgi:hypothetical protein
MTSRTGDPVAVRTLVVGARVKIVNGATGQAVAAAQGQALRSLLAALSGAERCEARYAI